MSSILGSEEELSGTVGPFEFSNKLAHLEKLRREVSEAIDKGVQSNSKFKSILEGNQTEFKSFFSEDEAYTEEVLQEVPKEPLEESLGEPIEVPTTVDQKPKLKKIVVKPKPTKPAKNFIKENIKSLKKKPPEPPEPQLPKSFQAPKPSKAPPKQVSEPKITASEKINIPAKTFQIKNEKLLSLVFKQFADYVFVQWEEAADLLIDELLCEQVEYFNAWEEEPQDSSEELYSCIQEVLLDEDRLYQKYMA